MRTTTHRRKAFVAALVVAAATALVPAAPASASIDEDAIFFASPTSDQVTVLAGGERTSVTAFPTRQVLAGHFTSDAGAQAFLYNPGPAPDGLLDVTRDGDGLEAQLTAAPVGGNFDPFVADLDLDGRDDIFWYAPGAARDYVWFFEADGSITSVPMKVDLVARPVPVLVDGINDTPARQTILWYGAGARPDSIWTFTGRSASARRVSIAGTYRVVVGNFNVSSIGHSREQVLFYDPAGGRNSMWTFHRGDGNHRSDPLPSPGRNYLPVVTEAGMHGGDFAYWYGPGPNPEKIWDWQGSKVISGLMPPIGGTYRVMRDAQGRAAEEELVLMGGGTTARTMQLAPEHSPLLGTVTPIPGLPTSYRGASTWFEEPVS
jgi:hypothetical protein